MRILTNSLVQMIFCAGLFCFGGAVKAQESAPHPDPLPQEDRETNFNDVASFNADLQLRPSFLVWQPVEFPARVLGTAFGGLRVLVQPQAEFYLSAVGRANVDFSVAGIESKPSPDYYGSLYLSDSYLKINIDPVSLSIGHFIVPWRVTRGAGFTDRINPLDHQRGPNFSDTLWTRVPQWGLSLQAVAWDIEIEALGFLTYWPMRGSLAASQQGGVQIGHYQTAFFQTVASSTVFTRTDAPFYETPSVGLRLKRRFGEIDVGFSGLWSFNEVPAMAGPDLSQLEQRRNVSFSLDVTIPISYFLLRAEGLIQPVMGGYGGKTALLSSPQGLATSELSSYAAAVALEGSYGESVNLSLELFDVMWLSVPAGQRLHGVESLGANNDSLRTVHRFAAAFVADGTLLESAIYWRTSGEVGIFQPDILANVETGYQWQTLGIRLGFFANIFAGILGSPGWFRQHATELGILVGHQI